LNNKQIRILPQSPLKWVSASLDQKDYTLFEYAEQSLYWDASLLGDYTEKPPYPLFLATAGKGQTPQRKREGVEPVYFHPEIPLAFLASLASLEEDKGAFLHYCFQGWPGHLVQEVEIPLKTLKDVLPLEDLNDRLELTGDLHKKKWKFLNTLGASHQFNGISTVYARWIHQASYCRVVLTLDFEKDPHRLKEIFNMMLLKIQSFQEFHKIAYRGVLRTPSLEFEFLPAKDEHEWAFFFRGIGEWERMQKPPVWEEAFLQLLMQQNLARIRAPFSFFQAWERFQK
jgi:hypothetical protein